MKGFEAGRASRRRLGAAVVLRLAPDARADAGAHQARAPHAISSSSAGDMAAVRVGGDRRRGSERMTPEQRLANGELLFRTKDYEQRDRRPQRDPRGASRDTPSLPRRALAPRRDVLRRARVSLRRRDYKDARRPRERAPLPAVLRPALARLVDVALRLNDPPERSTRSSRSFNQVPPAQVDAGLLYAKGKAYFQRRRRGTRRSSVRAGRPKGTPYTHQARYFQGLVAHEASRGRGAGERPDGQGRDAARTTSRPIEAFRAATELPPDTPEHQHVIDLAWMADRPPLLRDGAVPAGQRGLRQGRPGHARVRHDALRARVGLRAPRRRAARRAGARGALDRRSRTASTSATARSFARTCCFARARSTSARSSTRACSRSTSRCGQGRRRSSTRRQDVQRLLRQARAAAARPARPERPAPAARRPLGARGRGRPAGVRGDRRREPVQDAHPPVQRSSSRSSPP